MTGQHKNTQPAVAGVFYPVDPKQLHLMLEQYLQEAQTEAKVPKAIIAPHAGYVYSGPVAASAYARLKKAKDLITLVVIIGPSHRVAFRGLAVSRANAFSTPLGDIPVDQAAIEKLVQFPFVEYIEQAHTLEHSTGSAFTLLARNTDGFQNRTCRRWRCVAGSGSASP